MGWWWWWDDEGWWSRGDGELAVVRLWGEGWWPGVYGDEDPYGDGDDHIYTGRKGGVWLGLVTRVCDVCVGDDVWRFRVWWKDDYDEAWGWIGVWL